NDANIVDCGPVSASGASKCRDGGVTVLRVYCREKRIARQRNIASEAEQCAAVLGCPEFVGLAVELPKPDVHGSGRERHAFLALLEQELGAPPLTSLDQQGAGKSRLQTEQRESCEYKVAMLVPDARVLVQDDGARR